MNRYVKKTWICFISSLACLGAGVLLASWGAFLVSIVSLYLATFLLWRGWKTRSEYLRFLEEVQWWRNAKNGIEQDSLDPCCVLFGKTSLRHEEEYCTRRRFPKPRIISKGELEEIDRAWKEIIAHMDDPECGEEA
jgi:hypothetical protein